MKKTIYSDKVSHLNALLVAARKASGLTQAELAKKLKTPQNFVSYYERGGRRLDVVEFLEICATLGADPVKIIRALQDK
ncbi:MAG: multiprotein-bridging factor 1 family protein [Bdellovibrionales bacterium]